MLIVPTLGLSLMTNEQKSRQASDLAKIFQRGGSFPWKTNGACSFSLYALPDIRGVAVYVIDLTEVNLTGQVQICNILIISEPMPGQLQLLTH